MEVGRTWRKAKLRDRCERLRRDVLARELVDEDDLDEHWPDSPDDATKDDWWWCHGWLMHYRQREGVVPNTRDKAEQDILAAIQEEPETVRVADESGEEFTLEVYPKGLTALLRFRARDFCVDYLQRCAEAIKSAMQEQELDAETISDPKEVLERVETEVAHQLSVLVAAATQEGPDVDWDDALNPPERIQNLDPLHFVRLLQAFNEVNARRIEGLNYVAGPKTDDGQGRMSWNVFYGSMANKLNTTVKDLARDSSLVALLSQARLDSRNQRDRDLDVEAA